jgi:soluble lytic murein transglycosylase-like protein
VAHAQIYAWRDASGNMVLSDKQKDPSAQTYSVRTQGNTSTTEFRTTKPVSRRALPFESMIEEHAAVQGVSPHLVRAVIQQESGFNPSAVSHKGAMGLMQLMPATARELGVTNPYDPAQNIRGGTAYLRQLLDRYDGDERLALAAYNAGAGAVDRYGRNVPPYHETRDYVRRISLKAGTTTAQATPRFAIYKTIEIVDGRAIPRYSNQRPASGSFDIVRR